MNGVAWIITFVVLAAVAGVVGYLGYYLWHKHSTSSPPTPAASPSPPSPGGVLELPFLKAPMSSCLPPDAPTTCCVCYQNKTLDGKIGPFYTFDGGKQTRLDSTAVVGVDWYNLLEWQQQHKQRGHLSGGVPHLCSDDKECLRGVQEGCCNVGVYLAPGDNLSASEIAKLCTDDNAGAWCDPCAPGLAPVPAGSFHVVDANNKSVPVTAFVCAGIESPKDRHITVSVDVDEGQSGSIKGSTTLSWKSPDDKFQGTLKNNNQKTLTMSPGDSVTFQGTSKCGGCADGAHHTYHRCLKTIGYDDVSVAGGSVEFHGSAKCVPPFPLLTKCSKDDLKLDCSGISCGATGC